ncbi:alpha/beta-hydrolase [Stipitochalara longipes BDJ]|nr:alpha/beta-hydrolase [Stipitochalara longipes BDJ]
MDQIKALNDSAGQAIPAVLPSTIKIFVPLLMKNKAEIHAIPRKTESYGSHPRQKLDLYLPKEHSQSSPILAFFYGGGLVRGDKIIAQIPEGLVYANLGSFFASRGLTTVVADYRRVNSEIGGEDAVFPSGGEDVSLVLKWLETYAANSERDVYICGNSAGGVHISTFLFEPRFLEQRKSYLSRKTAITLKGAIEQSVPLHFKNASADRFDTLKLYYGSMEEVGQRCPYGLFETISKSGKSREEVGVPKVLVLLGDFDPQDEIEQPTEDFVALWKKTWERDIDFIKMEGHNHISPPYALLSNDKKGEKWAEDVVKWIQGSRNGKL